LLYRIAYQSQPTVPVTLQLVNGIVTVARKRNAAAGITGFLTFRPEWFLQVLEGEQEAVCRLFADIGKDRRHCGLTLLEHRVIARREFPAWSLGARLAPVGLQGHAALAALRVISEGSYNTRPSTAL
jgi:hypothetical protein